MTAEPIASLHERKAPFSWAAAVARLWHEPALWVRLRQDSAIYVVILLTMVAGYSIALLSGLNSPLVLAGYFLQILGDSIFAAGTMMCALLVVQAIRTRPNAPMKATLERASALGPAHMMASFALLTAVLNAHGAYSLLKRLLPVPYGFAWDKSFANFDRWLHLGTDPWRLLQPLADNSILLRVIQANYGAGWGVYIMALLAWICMSPRAATSRTRYLFTYFMVLFGLGTVVALLGASAGPLFYGAVTGDVARFAGLDAFVGQGGDGLGTVLMLRDYLWNAYTAHRLDIGSGISAFPSVHVATATFAALVIAEHSKWGGALAFAYLTLILFCSICLGWHYAIDGYFVIPIVMTCHFTARAIERRWGAGR
jgi:hypothetical protein